MTPHEAPKKERHIVSWTPEEDEILREQISIHGTENWTAISSKLNNKTSRQCRRRWYTYLNTECKKGGWSAEEDMLLCEAQRIFGNRWTEIAKVVSGRTDNAVKNRFTTLRKKRAKYEALSKENNVYINSQNKRVCQYEISNSSQSYKNCSTNILDLRENFVPKEKSLCEPLEDKKHPRPALAVLAQNFNNVEDPKSQHTSSINCGFAVRDALSINIQGKFLKRNDPKVTALMQQAELLGSLARKVNMDNTNQSLESVWKELQDFLLRSEESELLKCKIAEMDSLLEDFKHAMEDLKNGGPEQLSWSQPDLQEESQGSSEYSTGPSYQLVEQNQADECSLGQKFVPAEVIGEQNADIHRDYQDGDKGVKAYQLVEQNQADECSLGQKFVPAEVKGEQSADIHRDYQDGDKGVEMANAAIPSASKEPEDGNKNDYVLLTTDYGSPPQTLRPFYSFAEGIPSPEFSESEKRFLLRTFGLASPAACRSPIPLQPPPPCRRSLLDSL